MEPAWYHIQNIHAVDSPALVIYPDRIKENIRLLKKMSQGVDWLRPHVKTHKLAQVSRLLLEEGIYKFKCATIAEAEMLAMAGAKDVLLAYQPVGPKILRLQQLSDSYPDTTFLCIIDNVMAAKAINEVFARLGRPLNVFIDLNVGMNRTGIIPGNEAFELYIACQEMKGLRSVGLHAYDGHLRDRDIALRKQKCDSAFKPVAQLAERIAARDLAYPVIVAGGSPTFPIHATRKGVECSPGTFIFWDWGYHTQLPEQKFVFAALIVTSVI